MFPSPPRVAGAGEPEAPGLRAEQREQIEHALEELVASAPLRTSPQCQQLLRYVVENTLRGELSLLRERVIGKEVFGRQPAYDPSDDPVVRVRAADLRKRLALYYQSRVEPVAVRIEVPSGSYRASFVWTDERSDVTPTQRETQAPAEPAVFRVETAPHEPALVPDDRSLTERTRSRWLRLATCVALLVMVAAGALWQHSRRDPVRSFWAPLLTDSKPVLLSIGSNAVYRLDDARADAYAQERPPGNEGMEFYPKFQPEQTLASTGLHPTPDSFVALGDLAATSEVVRTLTMLGRGFEERFPNDVSFAEIHEHASVLIGGFNNPMTRELTRNLPFVMARRNRIEERDHQGRRWILQASSDSHDTEDYAIVTRLLGTRDTAPMLVLAGLGQYGTVAATDFVCRPESLRMLSATAGSDWRNKNLQAVLRIKVTDFKAVQTSIVAVRLW